ncbi:hypothetical protein ACIXMQ_19420 [Bacteroides fragilis]
MLSSDFVPWELVYYYYRKWSFWGEFDLLLNNLREKYVWKWNKLQELVWVLWIVKVFVGATIVPSTALMATKGLKESSVM